jgi:SAM-dependent methyltransferase
VVGDLEGTTTAELLSSGWQVSLVRLDGRAMGTTPAGAHLIAGTDDSLPILAASADIAVLIDALEYAIDDTALLGEAARVLKPGGQLCVRVPHCRRADWLDARNIYHYLRETTRRGDPLPEMGHGIFRRHYAADELGNLLKEAGFTIQEWQTSGVGASEVVYLGGAGLFRWATASRRFEAVRRLYGRLDRMEARWPVGSYYLSVLAVRSSPRLAYGVSG